MRKRKHYQQGYQDGWFRAVDAFSTVKIKLYDEGWNDGWDTAVEEFRKAGVFVPGLSLTLMKPLVKVEKNANNRTLARFNHSYHNWNKDSNFLA